MPGLLHINQTLEIVTVYLLMVPNVSNSNCLHAVSVCPSSLVISSWFFPRVNSTCAYKCVFAHAYTLSTCAPNLVRFKLLVEVSQWTPAAFCQLLAYLCFLPYLNLKCSSIPILFLESKRNSLLCPAQTSAAYTRPQRGLCFDPKKNVKKQHFLPLLALGRTNHSVVIQLQVERSIRLWSKI